MSSKDVLIGPLNKKTTNTGKNQNKAEKREESFEAILTKNLLSEKRYVQSIGSIL